MATQIQFRRGTAAQWTTANPVLAVGEFGLETDTGQFKVGNGSTVWASLAYGGLVGPAQTNAIQDFGDGSDGDVSLSSGITSLTRDMFYNNLTLSGTAQIVTNGYRIFVKGVLDLSAAGAFAINWNGSGGNNAVNQTGGTAVTVGTAQALGNGGQGTAGATGVVGAGAQAAAPTNLTPSNGGASVTSGAGGSGLAGANAGGVTRAGATVTNSSFLRVYSIYFIRGVLQILAGAGGPGGGSGGGDGVNLGRGGGAGGNGGGVIAIYAKQITRSGSTAAGAICSCAGAGGVGASGVAGNVGGGGGGSGGGGGFVYLAYESLSGTAATNMINADGGAGGNGGNGLGTGNGGNGGGGGNGGNIFALKTNTQVGTFVAGSAGAVGSAGAGTVAGTGGALGQCRLTV
jgi:hypothetical protein